MSNDPIREACETIAKSFGVKLELVQEIAHVVATEVGVRQQPMYVPNAPIVLVERLQSVDVPCGVNVVRYSGPMPTVIR